MSIQWMEEGVEKRTMAPNTAQTLFNLSKRLHEYSSVHLHSSWQRETHLPLKCRRKRSLMRPAFPDPDPL